MRVTSEMVRTSDGEVVTEYRIDGRPVGGRERLTDILSTR